ncbi:hypothetical protein INS49_013338 [Diaporthe citri]|uniref:uncharacterized protein n=1 Tax=Diaporthe citri TaxID=83186 RepID=UPI001C7F9BAD|nr:uncharacterized protein INS49_013338 [Diaporthe citri]KAG6357461.1 hypothetical protein INS49_013338 [Diaporthe citri]
MSSNTANVIKQKIFIQSINKDGATYTLSVATVTSDWWRPEDTAEDIGRRAAAVIQAWRGQFPQAARELCVRGPPTKDEIMQRQKYDNLSSKGGQDAP